MIDWIFLSCNWVASIWAWEKNAPLVWVIIEIPILVSVAGQHFIQILVLIPESDWLSHTILLCVTIRAILSSQFTDSVNRWQLTRSLLCRNLLNHHLLGVSLEQIGFSAIVNGAQVLTCVWHVDQIVSSLAPCLQLWHCLGGKGRYFIYSGHLGSLNSESGSLEQSWIWVDWNPRVSFRETKH